jgi:exopolysaccharide production protein ExoQ
MAGGVMTAREAGAYADRRRDDQSGGAAVAAGRVVWTLCCLSFFGLQSIQLVGTPGAVLFLAPWVVVISTRLRNLSVWLWRDKFLLALPAFALLSALWSTDPTNTLRQGLEYVATICIGIAAARCVKPRTLWTALMLALALATGASIVFARLRGVSFGSGGAVGIYGSKNQLASFSAILLLISMTFALTKAEDRFFRLLSLGIALEAVVGVILGRSAGTLVALMGSGLGAVAIRTSSKKLVPLFLIGIPVLCFGVWLVLDVGVDQIAGAALHGLGKDATLTGRTDLWAAGLREIQERPLLGIGYRGFWLPGNPVAERLWAMFGIFNKSGFHFHSTYINIGVEIGILGVIIFIFTIAILMSGVLLNPGRFASAPEAMIAFLLFSFYMISTFVEEEFFDPFYISTIVLCLFRGGYSSVRMSAPEIGPME